MGEQAATERAAGVRASEILGAEAAGIEQGDGEGVAEREGGGGAGGRCQVVRAGFLGDAGIEMHIGFARQGRLRRAGHGDQAGALALDQRHDAQQFLDSPELERASRTSSRVIMPRSPWLASAGWTK
jgi:hypothetical protein